MKNRIVVTSKDDFRTWQRKFQGLLQEAKEKETSLINEEFKEVLADFEVLEMEHKRIIAEMTALLDRQPKKNFSWEADSEIMEAHAAAMGEMERINVRFQTKWGNRYEEYLQVTAALEREFQKHMKLTKSRVAYKKAMANLAQEEAGGGEQNA